MINGVFLWDGLDVLSENNFELILPFVLGQYQLYTF
jgi:hypothetical protein